MAALRAGQDDLVAGQGVRRGEEDRRPRVPAGGVPTWEVRALRGLPEGAPTSRGLPGGTAQRGLPADKALRGLASGAAAVGGCPVSGR